MRQIIIQEKLRPYLIFFALCEIWCFIPSQAEVLCTVDISYKWKKVEKGHLNVTPTPSAQADAPVAGENTVHFSVVEYRAESESMAKQQMAADINRSKVRASEACRKDHEDVASCASMKFLVNAGTLNNLGFSARRELERTILDDCKASEGRCMGVEAAEPKCNEVVTGLADATPTADPAKGGGDKKKKK